MGGAATGGRFFNSHFKSGYLFKFYFRSFMGVTAHWICPITLARKSAALACRKMVGRHTYDVLADIIETVLNEYNILAKTTTAVTDNAANFVKAFKEFSTENNIHDDEDEEFSAFSVTDFFENAADDEIRYSLPQHKRCAAHTMNLIMSKDSEAALKSPSRFKTVYRSAIGKLTALWSKQNQSQPCADIIKEKIGRYFITPNATRWNSTVDSIKCFLDIFSKLEVEVHCICDKFSIPRLTFEEFECITEYLKVFI